jgi:transcriptional regulator
VVLPSHFLLDGDTVLLHFARANPVWKALEAAPTVLISVAREPRRTDVSAW